MRVQIHNSRKTILTVNPLSAGTSPGYQLAYLSESQKEELRFPLGIEYAVRIDGNSAQLVKVIQGYTAHRYDATILV